DSFSYRLFDGTLYSPATIVTLTTVESGATPVALADAFHTNQDASLSVLAAAGVLANDHGAPLTATVVTTPAHSAVNGFTLNPDGSFSYTPATGFTGVDRFTYQASDGTTTSNVQQVTIAVLSATATRIATNDAYTTTHDQPISVS